MPPSHSSLQTFLYSFKFILPFHINCNCLHTCMCTYIPKYKFLSMHKVNCIYFFRADHLLLNIQFICSTLRRQLLLPYFSKFLRVFV